MITLAIDASTYVGSVAVLRGGEVLATGETAMRGREEERLMPAVAATLGSAGVALAAVDRVACGAGPGSFTSLRIAASIAKGIAVAIGRPLVAMPSIALMVAAVRPALPPGRYVGVLDALRSEWFVATCVLSEGGVVRQEGAVRLVARDELDAAAAALGGPVVGAGLAIDGAPRAWGAPGVLPASPAVDVATWEPVYGRLAEAQARWEAAHGRELGA